MPVANRVTALAVVIFCRTFRTKYDCVGSRTKKCDESALVATASAVSKSAKSAHIFVTAVAVAQKTAIKIR